MYEIRYVSKRIRRLAIAIGAGVSATVVSVFSIVAFLGRFVGTFTVSLDNSNVSLALSETTSFENPVSFLHINELPPYDEMTYTQLPSDEELDSEETDYLYGANHDPEGNVTSLNYFKYTFYVKNVGNVSARYQFRINILENAPSEASEGSPSRYLDDTLRVMLYSNSEKADTHDKTVYAKRRAIAYEPGNSEIIYKEPISFQEDKVPPGEEFQGYAEMFESQDVIATLQVDGFERDAINRYTLVMWLEGWDPQTSHLEKAPLGAKIKIGVEINAYEN